MVKQELIDYIKTPSNVTNMKKPVISELIRVDECSATPKYMQIVNSIIREIGNGKIKAGDSIPSINELSIEHDIARDTVERGYKQLKRIGIIDSVPRRGYYIKHCEVKRRIKILLLFNKLSAHKKVIYDSFVNALSGRAFIDFHIYNNDSLLFRKLITDRNQDYTHYVIIPHFIDGHDRAIEVVNSLPKEKLLLLDKVIPGISGNYAAAYENFEKDIYNALSEASERLSRYNTIKLIFPPDSYYPAEIIRGFRCYCQEHGFRWKIVNNISDEVVSAGDVYINVMEDNLVTLLEKLTATDFVIGEQVGIISYNETPVKQFILNGITTISTDFQQMGITAAQMILSNVKESAEIPFKLTLRSSL